MSLVSSAGALPAAAPGSTRYLVLLYCPLERRAALATLLAVADEIGAGLRRPVDHSVAHVRLEWWRQEAQRFACGQPQHPWLTAWLRAYPDDRALELEGLTQAAAIDLATARLAGGQEHALLGALFILGAQLLGLSAPSGAVEQSIRALGRYTAELEQREAEPARPSPPARDLELTRASSEPPREAHARPQGLVAPMLEPALQPRIAPLLVWTSLARLKARRREQRGHSGGSAATGSRLDLLTDNLVAWRAARQALRGRYRGE